MKLLYKFFIAEDLSKLILVIISIISRYPHVYNNSTKLSILLYLSFSCWFIGAITHIYLIYEKPTIRHLDISILMFNILQLIISLGVFVTPFIVDINPVIPIITFGLTLLSLIIWGMFMDRKPLPIIEAYNLI